MVQTHSGVQVQEFFDIFLRKHMIQMTSFVLGMVMIVALLAIAFTIVGIVKMNKIQTQQLNLNKQFEEVYQNINYNDEHLRRLIDDIHREMNMVEKTIMNQVQQVDRDHHSIEDAIHREIDQTKSYIDSRIDKVVAQGTLKSSKQLIKG